MLGFEVLLVIAAAAGAVVEAAPAVEGRNSLPTVNLGYTVHQATVNSSGYPSYKFSNIRFGSPPVGNARFTVSTLPTGKNSTVNDGQKNVICPQANPAWLAIAGKFLTGTPVSQLMDPSKAPPGGAALNLSSLPMPDPSTSEDCLFLDVVVPQSIYDARSSTEPEDDCDDSCEDKGAAVMVWIYGGGYTGGSKSGSGNPATLLANARKNGQKGVVYVGINYRLGLYGWLSGPTFQANGTANAGLYDQELALRWIQKYIHLFGGSRKRVTVFGESAGAGSIMHQITAYGGLKGKVPFRQAISQSPGFLPQNSNNQLEATFQQTLGYASLVTKRSIKTTQDLRSLSFMELYYTNVIAVGLAVYGFFEYGPTVDGKFVPKLPGELLLHGQFDKSVKVMLGHNLNEGLLFASPFIQNETDFNAYIRQTLPAATTATVNFVENTLYPPVFDGSLGYKSQLERTSLLISEFSFVCNTRYLDTAYKNETYSYYFTVPPGLHGEDIAYTYFNGDLSTLDNGAPVNATVATLLQEYLTSFAQTGSPNEAGIPYFPIYGTNSSTELLATQNLGTQVKDTAANDRCTYFQKALYI